MVALRHISGFAGTYLWAKVSSPEAPPSRRLRDVALRTGGEGPPTTTKEIMMER